MAMKKTLCKSKAVRERSRLQRSSKPVSHQCKKCGRLSTKKKWLCKPKRADTRRKADAVTGRIEREIMKNLDREKVCRILNTIIEYEMAGVVRYAHSSLMVIGPYRQPIVQFLQEQATESLQHALEAGELITGLDGHPSQKIAEIEESNDHSVTQILAESLDHEQHAVSLYQSLLNEVSDASVMLEEYARGKISAEEQHALEVRKMLKDYSPTLQV
jgi:bacterioferritin